MHKGANNQETESLVKIFQSNLAFKYPNRSFLNIDHKSPLSIDLSMIILPLKNLQSINHFFTLSNQQTIPFTRYLGKLKTIITII